MNYEAEIEQLQRETGLLIAKRERARDKGLCTRELNEEIECNGQSICELELAIICPDS